MNFFKKLFGRKEKQKAPDTVLDGSHGDLIVAFQEIIAGKIQWEELKNTEFAMWFPTEEDKRFSDSEIINIWTEIFGITGKYWSYITADLLKIIGVAEENQMRLALPEDGTSYAFMTKNNEQIILSLSVEKGIRFHFSSTTAYEFRVLFLKYFLNYCKGWDGLLRKLNQPVDEKLEFADWWSLTVRASKMADVNEPILAVGKIII